MFPSGHLRRSISIAVRSAMKRCWSMKRSLMWPLVRPNSAGNIRAGCPQWGVQDATARPWSTSSRSPSPPRGRYVQRHKLSDGEPLAYALGNAGAGELTLSYGIDRKEIDYTTRNRENSERYIRHALMVTSFRHAVEVSLRDMPDLTLKLWEP